MPQSEKAFPDHRHGLLLCNDGISNFVRNVADDVNTMINEFTFIMFPVRTLGDDFLLSRCNLLAINCMVQNDGVDMRFTSADQLGKKQENGKILTFR